MAIGDAAVGVDAGDFDGRRLRALAGLSAAFVLLAIAGAVVLNVRYRRQMDSSIGTVRATLLDEGAAPAAENPTAVR